MSDSSKKIYDAFASYSHKDRGEVEYLVEKLRKEGFHIFLDTWDLVPGDRLIPAITEALDNSENTIIFLGKEKPKGFVAEEIQKSILTQIKNKNFGVIPVLLPGSDISSMEGTLLENRVFVRFKDSLDDKWQFYNLVCGIKGVPPGPRQSWEANLAKRDDFERVKSKLEKIKELGSLVDHEVVKEFQRILLKEILGDEG